MNPHPPLAVFPVVLGLVAVGLELIALKSQELSPAKLRAIMIAVTSFLIALCYYSGFWGAEFATTVSQEEINEHQGFAKLVLLVQLPLLLFSAIALLGDQKRPVIVYLYRAILIVNAVLLIVTSHLGGDIVFEHGGGVEGVGYTP